MKCPHCDKDIESSQWLDVSDVLPNMEVELEVHDKNKSWNDLKLSEKEDQLLTVEQCITLANSKYAQALKMDGSSSKDDFFIQQPFNLNKKNNYVARFNTDSDRASLVYGGGPSSTFATLGVRLIRAKKKRVKT